MPREKRKWEVPMSVRVPMRSTGAEQLVVAMRVPNGTGAKGLHRPALQERTTSSGRILLSEAKPFSISKRLIWEAYKRVKANGGAAGVDRQTIEEFEVDLK